jgi:hypothetical protein
VEKSFDKYPNAEDPSEMDFDISLGKFDEANEAIQPRLNGYDLQWSTQPLGPGRILYLIAGKLTQAGMAIGDDEFQSVLIKTITRGIHILNNDNLTRAIIYRAENRTVHGASSETLLCAVRGRYRVAGFQTAEYSIGRTLAYKCAIRPPTELMREYRILNDIPTSWNPPELCEDDDVTLLSSMTETSK